MITWMLYTAVIGALVGIASLALERVAAARALRMRFVWAASMIVSVGWAAASAIRRLLPDIGEPVRLVHFSITLEPTRAMTAGAMNAGRAAMIDRGLLVLWIALSVLLLARLLVAVRTLRRTRATGVRRTSTESRCDCRGMSDRRSSGFARWTSCCRMDHDARRTFTLRALVLRHEEEHRSARDPYLLFASAIAVALMPWNLALWLQAKRLRLAIEMDCDARVLRAHPSPERYGLLMLTIAQRRSIAPPMFAPMLSEPTSQLERRIIAMRTMTHKVARATVVAGMAIAVSVLLFACALQSDSPMSPKPGVGSRTLQRGRKMWPTVRRSSSIK
jgi:beta-lactamase regulating signal transducer with metallopeptidase domain